MPLDQHPPVGRAFPGMPLSPGRYYNSQLVSVVTTMILAAGTLYATPFLVPAPYTFTGLAIEVTGLSALKSMRLGIYTDTNGAPDALVLDAGTVSVASTGGKNIVISQLLGTGWYWLAGVTDGTPTVRALQQSGSMQMLGFASTTDVTVHVGWSVAFAYAALPNPFTGGGTLMTTAAPRFMLGL